MSPESSAERPEHIGAQPDASGDTPEESENLKQRAEALQRKVSDFQKKLREYEQKTKDYGEHGKPLRDELGNVRKEFAAMLGAQLEEEMDRRVEEFLRRLLHTSVESERGVSTELNRDRSPEAGAMKRLLAPLGDPAITIEYIRAFRGNDHGSASVFRAGSFVQKQTALLKSLGREMQGEERLRIAGLLVNGEWDQLTIKQTELRIAVEEQEIRKLQETLREKEKDVHAQRSIVSRNASVLGALSSEQTGLIGKTTGLGKDITPQLDRQAKMTLRATRALDERFREERDLRKAIDLRNLEMLRIQNDALRKSNPDAADLALLRGAIRIPSRTFDDAKAKGMRERVEQAKTRIRESGQWDLLSPEEQALATQNDLTALRMRVEALRNAPQGLDFKRQLEKRSNFFVAEIAPAQEFMKDRAHKGKVLDAGGHKHDFYANVSLLNGKTFTVGIAKDLAELLRDPDHPPLVLLREPEKDIKITTRTHVTTKNVGRGETLETEVVDEHRIADCDVITMADVVVREEAHARGERSFTFREERGSGLRTLVTVEGEVITGILVPEEAEHKLQNIPEGYTAVLRMIPQNAPRKVNAEDIAFVKNSKEEEHGLIVDINGDGEAEETYTEAAFKEQERAQENVLKILPLLTPIQDMERGGQEIMAQFGPLQSLLEGMGKGKPTREAVKTAQRYASSLLEIYNKSRMLTESRKMREMIGLLRSLPKGVVTNDIERAILQTEQQLSVIDRLFSSGAIPKMCAAIAKLRPDTWGTWWEREGIILVAAVAGAVLIASGIGAPIAAVLAAKGLLVAGGWGALALTSVAGGVGGYLGAEVGKGISSEHVSDFTRHAIGAISGLEYLRNAGLDIGRNTALSFALVGAGQYLGKWAAQYAKEAGAQAHLARFVQRAQKALSAEEGVIEKFTPKQAKLLGEFVQELFEETAIEKSLENLGPIGQAVLVLRCSKVTVNIAAQSEIGATLRDAHGVSGNIHSTFEFSPEKREVLLRQLQSEQVQYREEGGKIIVTQEEQGEHGRVTVETVFAPSSLPEALRTSLAERDDDGVKLREIYGIEEQADGTVTFRNPEGKQLPLHRYLRSQGIIAPLTMSDGTFTARIGGKEVMFRETSATAELTVDTSTHMEKDAQNPEMLGVKDVREIMKKRQVLFFHGMKDLIPSRNSLLMEDGRVDFRTKLRLLLALEPTLSTSTVKAGDHEGNIWSHVGVLLSGGSIRDAGPQDLGSVANGNQREVLGGKYGKQSIGELVDFAIDARHQHGYNELAVARPRVAALYVVVDKNGGISPDATEVFGAGKEMDIPVFAVREGRIYEVTLTMSEGHDKTGERKPSPSIELGKEVDRESLLQQGKVLSLDERKAMLEETLRGMPFDPFKLKLTEAEDIRYWESGDEAATVLLARFEGGVLQGDPVTYRKLPREKSPIPDGTTVQAVKTFDAFGGGHEYFLFNEKLYMRNSYGVRRAKSTMSAGDEGYLVQTEPVTDYRSGVELSTVSGKPFSTPEEYLDALAEDTPIWQHGYREKPEFYRPYVRGLAFHLYGFAEGAERVGQNQIAARARSLAESVGVISPSEYREEVKRRVHDGKFMLQLEDIPGTGALKQSTENIASSLHTLEQRSRNPEESQKVREDMRTMGDTEAVSMVRELIEGKNVPLEEVKAQGIDLGNPAIARAILVSHLTENPHLRAEGEENRNALENALKGAPLLEAGLTPKKIKFLFDAKICGIRDYLPRFLGGRSPSPEQPSAMAPAERSRDSVQTPRHIPDELAPFTPGDFMTKGRTVVMKILEGTLDPDWTFVRKEGDRYLFKKGNGKAEKQQSATLKELYAWDHEYATAQAFEHDLRAMIREEGGKMDTENNFAFPAYFPESAVGRVEAMLHSYGYVRDAHYSSQMAMPGETGETGSYTRIPSGDTVRNGAPGKQGEKVIMFRINKAMGSRLDYRDSGAVLDYMKSHPDLSNETRLAIAETGVRAAGLEPLLRAQGKTLADYRDVILAVHEKGKGTIGDWQPGDITGKIRELLSSGMPREVAQYLLDAGICGKVPERGAETDLVRKDAHEKQVTTPLDLERGFTIALPDEAVRSLHPETANQEVMYELRKLILQSAPDSQLVWLPQAVEALIRSQRSDLLPDLGHIRGLQVDTQAQRVRVLTRGETTGAFELSFDKLRPFSLELQLQELEAHENPALMPYSPEMVEALGHLSESARYRWDLITRAARCAAGGQMQVQDGRLRVSTVGPDILSNPHGVGAFFDREHRSRFSILKVTEEEVPLTPQEKQWMLMCRATNFNSEVSTPEHMREYFSGLADIADVLKETYPDLTERRDSSRRGGARLEEIFLWMRRANVTLLKRGTDEYRALEVLKAYEQVQQAADFGAEREGLMELYRAKRTYRDEHPFEFTEADGTEGTDRVHQALERLHSALVAFNDVLARNCEVVLQALPSEAGSSPGQRRIERIRRVVTGDLPALPGIKGTAETAGWRALGLRNSGAVLDWFVRNPDIKLGDEERFTLAEAGVRAAGLEPLLRAQGKTLADYRDVILRTHHEIGRGHLGKLELGDRVAKGRELLSSGMPREVAQYLLDAGICGKAVERPLDPGVLKMAKDFAGASRRVDTGPRYLQQLRRLLTGKQIDADTRLILAREMLGRELTPQQAECVRKGGEHAASVFPQQELALLHTGRILTSFVDDIAVFAQAGMPALQHIDFVRETTEQNAVLKNTGGYFDAKSARPRVVMAIGNQEHYERLLRERDSSVRWCAEKLGIRPEEMTPQLLCYFISLHEWGHAHEFSTRFWKGGNVEDAKKQWGNMNKSEDATLPIPHMNPAKLLNLLENRSTPGFAHALERHIRQTPGLLGRLQKEGVANAAGTVDYERLRTLQNERYRALPSETYADDFAVRSLKPRLSQFLAHHTDLLMKFCASLNLQNHQKF